jgi:hypothetical protein
MIFSHEIFQLRCQNVPEGFWHERYQYVEPGLMQFGMLIQCPEFKRNLKEEGEEG